MEPIVIAWWRRDLGHTRCAAVLLLSPQTLFIVVWIYSETILTWSISHQVYIESRLTNVFYWRLYQQRTLSYRILSRLCIMAFFIVLYQTTAFEEVHHLVIRRSDTDNDQLLRSEISQRRLSFRILSNAPAVLNGTVDALLGHHSGFA